LEWKVQVAPEDKSKVSIEANTMTNNYTTLIPKSFKENYNAEINKRSWIKRMFDSITWMFDWEKWILDETELVKWWDDLIQKIELTGIRTDNELAARKSIADMESDKMVKGMEHFNLKIVEAIAWKKIVDIDTLNKIKNENSSSVWLYNKNNISEIKNLWEDYSNEHFIVWEERAKNISTSELNDNLVFTPENIDKQIGSITYYELRSLIWKDKMKQLKIKWKDLDFVVLKDRNTLGKVEDILKEKWLVVSKNDIAWIKKALWSKYIEEWQ
jgi:hypothetical protein